MPLPWPLPGIHGISPRSAEMLDRSPLDSEGDVGLGDDYALEL